MAQAIIMDLYDSEEDSLPGGKSELVGYVIDKNREWQEYAESNYYSKWDEYYRIWRGIWDEADKTKQAERSRIITPATQQAVESSVCEIEEATFGQGNYFDIRDDNVEKTKLSMAIKQQAQQAQQGPQGPMAQGGQMPQKPPMDTTAAEEKMAFLRRQLDEDFRKQKVRASTSEVLINAAVWGTGIAEVVIAQENELRPATEDVMDGQLVAFGVNRTSKVVIKMKPVLIKNFRIDPVATSVESAHGVAIQEFVSAHQVANLQKEGVYL